MKLRSVVSNKTAFYDGSFKVQLPKNVSSYSSLSNRELEILELLGHGTPTRQISEKLFISVKTVETHYAHIKRKLGVRTQPQLLRLAFNWLNEL